MTTTTPLPWRVGNAGTAIFGPPRGNPSPVTVASNLRRGDAALIAKRVNASTKLTVAQNEAWQSQAKADALAWHKANMGKRLTSEKEEAYSTGFSHGWQECIKTLKLHGII
jgi:hypothetical protein